MAEEEASPDAGSAEGEEEKAAPKRKIVRFAIIGVAVVVLGGGGYFAYTMFAGGSDESHGDEAAHGDEDADAHGGDSEEASNDSHGESDGSGSEKADDSSEGDGEKSESETIGSEGDGEGFGESYSFKTFHLNLGNPLENNYVRLEVSVEYKGGESQKAEIEKRLPQLRDAINSVVGRKTREFLLGPHGKDQLRREIMIRINRYMSKPVSAVYITDILIE